MLREEIENNDEYFFSNFNWINCENLKNLKKK